MNSMRVPQRLNRSRVAEKKKNRYNLYIFGVGNSASGMPVRSGLVILFQEFPDECVTWRHIASSQLMWHLRLRGVVHRKGLSTNFRFSFQESHVLVALGSQTRRHMDSSGSATNNDNTLFLHVSKLQQLQQSQIDKLYQTVIKFNLNETSM